MESRHLPLRALQGNYTDYFHSHTTGQKVVTWPYLVARDTGKCSLFSLANHVNSLKQVGVLL